MVFSHPQYTTVSLSPLVRNQKSANLTLSIPFFFLFCTHKRKSQRAKVFSRSSKRSSKNKKKTKRTDHSTLFCSFRFACWIFARAAFSCISEIGPFFRPPPFFKIGFASYSNVTFQKDRSIWLAWADTTMCHKLGIEFGAFRVEVPERRIGSGEEDSPFLGICPGVKFHEGSPFSRSRAFFLFFG